jgi:hypothetical protein
LGDDGSSGGGSVKMNPVATTARCSDGSSDGLGEDGSSSDSSVKMDLAAVIAGRRS